MLLLVDISMWNVFVDYRLLAKRTDGVFIKATDGPSLSVDKHSDFNSGFSAHWEETKKVGLPRGAYHFWGPDVNAVKQARLFFDTVNATGDLGEFPPVLDVEHAGDGANVHDCIREIERLFQRTPILYTREGVFKSPVYDLVPSTKKGQKAVNKKDDKKSKKDKKKNIPMEKVHVDGLIGDLSWGNKYPLWVANYLMDDLDPNVQEKQLLPWSDDLIERWVTPELGSFPRLPKVYRDTGWKIWQFAQIGDGADWGQDPINSKQIDLNVYNGSLKDLVALGRPGGLPADWVDRKDKTGGVDTPVVIPTNPIDKPEDVETPIVDSGQVDNTPGNGETPAPEPTYPDLTNQDILNLFNTAANDAGWWDWVVRAGLNGLAASPEFRRQAYTGPKFEDLPGLTESERKALLQHLPGGEPPRKEAGFWIEVTKKSTECKYFIDGDEGRDGKGKPIMISHDPPIILTRGTRLWVSAEHKESDIDAGDGTIFATGREPYYRILESPDKRKAEGTFVQKKATGILEK